jgi:hypothetical protein
MSNWSSFEEDKKYADAWREFLTENEDEEVELDEGLWDKIKTAGKAAKAAWKGHDVSKQFSRGSGARAAMAATGAQVPGLSRLPTTGAPEEKKKGEEEEEEAPPQIQMPPPPQPKQVKQATGDAIPISGTELKIMNHIAKSKGTDIFKVVRDTMAGLGAAKKNPQVVPIIKAFNSILFPQIANLSKRVNIDVAENLDMEKFLSELLQEIENEPLTRRQQAQKKGVARGGVGAMAYFKSMGGKPPLIARNIEKNLTKALVDGVNSDLMFDAVSEVGATIKDPKARKQYEDSYLKGLEKDPMGRLRSYKQNVSELVHVVVKMATDAAAKAVGQAKTSGAVSGQARRRLPEHVTQQMIEMIKSKI